MENLEFIDLPDGKVIVFGGVDFVFRKKLPKVDARVVTTNLRAQRYRRRGGILLKSGLTFFVDESPFPNAPNIRMLWLRFNKKQGVLVRLS